MCDVTSQNIYQFSEVAFENKLIERDLVEETIHTHLQSRVEMWKLSYAFFLSYLVYDKNGFYF